MKRSKFPLAPPISGKGGRGGLKTRMGCVLVPEELRPLAKPLRAERTSEGLRVDTEVADQRSLFGKTTPTRQARIRSFVRVFYGHVLPHVRGPIAAIVAVGTLMAGHFRGGGGGFRTLPSGGLQSDEEAVVRGSSRPPELGIHSEHLGN